MNYLGRNLNNSLILPYDVMKLIYEYADPLIAVRKQINNKDYYLHKTYTYQKEDIINIPHHYPINNKKCFMICDLRYAGVYKYKRLRDEKYKMKNVYKKWLRL
jgi:hypothetical protein